MTDRGFKWLHYWSVDFPGLSQPDADRLVELARVYDVSDAGVVLDPVETYVLGMDVVSVSTLRVALELAVAADGLTSQEKVIAASVAEQLADWLEARGDEVRSRPGP